jgi:DNA-binding MarR family transcriptional regulator
MTDPDGDLRRADDALVRLRRLWSSAHTRPMADDDPPVEMSSVLVVEACARAAATGAEPAVADVAAFADVEHSTASRLVDRAVRAGLVTRTRSARDARRSALHLTGAGRALQHRATAFRLGWLAGVLADWPRDDVTRFAQLLDRFAERVGDAGPWSRQPPPGPDRNGPGG